MSERFTRGEAFAARCLLALACLWLLAMGLAPVLFCLKLMGLI